jgi:hypothetical protein
MAMIHYADPPILLRDVLDDVRFAKAVAELYPEAAPQGALPSFFDPA